MKQILSVIQKVSSTEVKAVDGVGRSKILAGGSSLNVGDSILVVNNVIIQKIKPDNSETYEV